MALDRFLLALATASIIACSDDPDEDGDDVSTGAVDGSDGSSGGAAVDVDMLAACDEADLQATPFMGAAFDPATGALIEPLPASYVVATTVGWAKPTAEDNAAMQDASNRVINEQLFAQDGLLGGSFGLSEACGSARTITIWRDDAARMAFVFSGVHLEMATTKLVHTQAWETTHWSESASEVPTWDAARQRLADARH